MRKTRSFSSKVKSRMTRANNKLKEEFPLLVFGGLVRFLTYHECALQQVAREQEAFLHQEKMERFKQKMFKQALKFRLVVEKYATKEEMVEFDKRRLMRPKDPTYACDFWRGVLTREHPEWLEAEAKARGLEEVA